MYLKTTNIPAKGRNKNYKYLGGSISTLSNVAASGSSTGTSTSSWLETYFTYDDVTPKITSSVALYALSLYSNSLLVATIAGTETLTNKTLTAPKCDSIRDLNGNEVFKCIGVTNAVNELTITNATTGNAVFITASGDDTNINLLLEAKGTGYVRAESLYIKDKYIYDVQSPTTNIGFGTSSFIVNAAFTIFNADIIVYGELLIQGIYRLKYSSVTSYLELSKADETVIVSISNAGNITAGDTTKTSDTVVKALSGDANKAGFEAYGSVQGTGYLYVGQSPTFGGGIEYNGDGNPVPAGAGAGADMITLYRRSNGVDYWTARNYQVNNNWEFRGNITSDYDVYALRYMGSTSFVSGILGAGTRWQLTSGDATYFEIDNMRVRNELRVHIFKKDIVKACNGYLFITDAAEIAETVTISTTADKFKVVEDGTNASFDSGMLLWAKNIQDDGSLQVTGVKITVGTVYTTGTTNGKDWTQYNIIAVENGGVLNAGDTIVRISGGYLMNDASSEYAPFLDVYDGVTTWSEFGSTSKLKARLGSLTGITDAVYGALSGYGLYSSNCYLTGGIVATYGKIAGWTIDSSSISKTDTDMLVSMGVIEGSSMIGFHVKNTGATSLTRVSMGYVTDTNWGLAGTSAGTVIFQLGSTNQIAGWEFNSYALWKSETTDGTVNIIINNSVTTSPDGANRGRAGFTIYKDGSDAGFKLARMGRIPVRGAGAATWTAATDDWGFQLGGYFDSVYKEIFRVDSDGATIASWNFDGVALWSGTKAGVGVTLYAGTSPYILVEYNSTNYIKTYYTSSSDWGIIGKSGGNTVFQLGSTNKIACFTIGTNRIGVEDSGGGGDYEGLALYDEFIKFSNDDCFAAIGANVMPAGTGIACGRFENETTTLGTNYGIIISATNGNRNVAIQATGDIISTSLVTGYNFRSDIPATTVVDILSFKSSVQFVHFINANSGVGLPTKASIKASLGISTSDTTTPFSVTFTIIVGMVSDETGQIWGRNTHVSGMNTSEYAYRIDNTGTSKITPISASKGDVFIFQMLFDGTDFYAYTINSAT